MNKKNRLLSLLCICLQCICLLTGGCGKEKEPMTEESERMQSGSIIEETEPAAVLKYAENECLKDEDGGGQIEFSRTDAADVRINLGQPEGLPLLKKLSQFTVGTDKLTNVASNAKYLRDLHAPTMRYPLSIWGTDYSDKLVKYWVQEAYNNVGNIFANNGTPVMYWHLAGVESAYNYAYAGNNTEDAAFYPPVIPTYAQAWKTAAQYIRESGHRAYYEVLNECDHDAWYKGTWQEYVDIYTAVSKAVREGDPYAEVGGLSSGGLSRLLGQENLDLFLNSVEKEGAPLDFASYHDYFQVYQTDTKMLADALDKSDYFKQTQMHLNEFNVYWPDDVYSDVKSGDDLLKTSGAVPLIFDALEYFSRHPEITMVHWGCFSDISEGLDLFTDEGEPLASYYALKTYQNMPVERVHAESGRDTVRVMASANAKEGGIVLWNSGDNQEEVTLSAEGIPSAGGMLEVYRIDRENASPGEGGTAEYEPLEAYGNLTNDAFTWKGAIPSGGTVYIRWIQAEGASQEKDSDASQLGEVIRKHYYYEDRSKNTYSEFDENTHTLYMGMGDQSEGMARCGVVFRNGKDVLKGRITADGCQRDAARGTIGMRIDYSAGINEYAQSVYVLFGGMEPEYDGYPWGTGENPEQILREEGTEFSIPIAKLAPDDWNGEYVLSFEIMDREAGGTVKLEF